MEGFEGDNCQYNIYDCEGDPCQNGGECFDGDNKYLCVCPHGFEGIYSLGCVKCLCESDNTTFHISGKDCEINIDDCANTPCKNNGICHDLVNDIRCECMPGYKGKLCETNIDECSSYKGLVSPANTTFVPCGNKGFCKDLINDYECDCQVGWRGKNCEINIDECLSSPCVNGGTCRDSIGKLLSKTFRKIMNQHFTF